jgi:hypothetical protein
VGINYRTDCYGAWRYREELWRDKARGWHLLGAELRLNIFKLVSRKRDGDVARPINLGQAGSQGDGRKSLVGTFDFVHLKSKSPVL